MVGKEKTHSTSLEHQRKPDPKGNLYLIPTPIGTMDTFDFPQICAIVKHLKFFFAEDLRSARRFISGLNLGISIETLQFELVNKDTDSQAIHALMSKIPPSEDIGYLSEAGCPGIADPGALLVRWFHQHSRRVIPMVGPSSLLLALMASGLNGQQFCFHGYLPVDKAKRQEALQRLEKQSRSQNQTQMFIETPYRNESMMASLLEHLSPDTLMCVALGLQMPEESIRTQKIKQWKLAAPLLPKAPAVFLFLAS